MKRDTKSKKKKKKARWASRALRGVLYVGAWVCGMLITSLALYCTNLSNHIEERFSGQRWSIPSKVFSATTILYPGQGINRELFLNKLHRLGYRDVTRLPKNAGEIHSAPGALDIFLHDLSTPIQTRPGFPLRIWIADSRISAMEHLYTQESVALAELEPEEITSFFGPERERRRLVSLHQVPNQVINAVLAAEDMRFYRHHGIDVLGIVRAAYINVRHFAIRQGGSTITQQLAKSYFLTPERTVTRKLKELLISIMLEGMYDKDEILEIYLNEIYLGQRGPVSINGIGEASVFYFGKSVEDLSLAEAATLAGLIRAPNYYSPYKQKERCRKRRDQVLNSMHQKQLITAADMKTALKAPLETVGFYAYRRQAPYFIDYLFGQLSALYPPEALTGLGLSIYTTLDTEVQEAAEAALEKGLKRLEQSIPTLRRSGAQEKLQGAIVVIQPKTGHILAMVGGREYGVSQYNRITQARRQPGSAFKPFVFLCGLDSFTPVSFLDNSPRTYMVNQKSWQPRNYESIPETRISVRRALAESINVATVDLAMQVGLGRIVDTAHKFGISTMLQPYPSLALGSFEIIPLELARAYCAFAADGVLPYPLSLQEVLDSQGEPLDRRHTTIERVTSPEKAFMMNSLLRGVVEEGTGRSLRSLGVIFPVAGKTGTTNDFKDAWFIGYTPDILALVWVGFDNSQSLHVSGARAALPIWGDLVKLLPGFVSGQWFRQPPGVVQRVVCADTGLLAIANGCLETREEFFLANHVPTEFCALHAPPSPLEQIFQGIKDAFKGL